MSEHSPAAPDMLSTPQVEASQRWVRVKCGQQMIANSRRTLLLRQYPPAGLPAYYFPPSDVRMDMLRVRAGATAGGDLEYRDVLAAGRSLENAAWVCRGSAPGHVALAGYVSFQWHLMDAWYEEEEEIFVHARDPYSRVDAMHSSRHVRVEYAGSTLAETRRPVVLFETHLPPRYYIPREDVRQPLLTPSTHSSRCPYKGIASYWSVVVNGRQLENLVWSYADPIPECAKIRGLQCFFNERVDIYVDDVLSAVPRTPWSEDE